MRRRVGGLRAAQRVRVPLVSGDGVYCFAVESPNADGADYNSREAATGKPSVAITVDPACTPCIVPTTTTTSTTLAPATTTTTTTTLVPPPAPTAVIEADAMVVSDQPGTNFGGNILLTADASPAVKRVFLRARVTGVGARTVTGAQLQLQVARSANAQSNVGGTLHAITSCGWLENTVTWNNQPAINGANLGTKGAVALGQTVSFNVGSVVTGDGVYCFGLDTTSSDGVDYNSKEGAAARPALVLTVAP